LSHVTISLRLLGVFLLSALTACVSSRAQRCLDAGDPAELARLAALTDSTAAALRQARDSGAVVTRQYLQSLVDRVAELDACRRITSAVDLRTAAGLANAASALGLETAERAYRWGRRAVLADTADRASWREMAHAWDQLQVLQRKPQWFATIWTCPLTGAGRCRMAPIDTTFVSDAQRAELGLRTLAQQRELLDSLNRARTRP
jgi:hypothetical protein